MATSPNRVRRFALRADGELFPRASELGVVVLRVLVGLMWLYNVAWKRPPDFGQDTSSGLYKFTSYAVSYPVVPPYSWLVENLVLPNFAAFGWLVLVVETLLAVLLLTGTFIRPAALVGVGQATAIALSVARAPDEWPWSYWLMIGVHVALVLAASASLAGVDGVRTAGESTFAAACAGRLLRGWGLAAAAVGVVAVVLTVGTAPFAAGGRSVGDASLALSVGTYNLTGALALLVIAASLLGVAATRRPSVGYLGGSVAVVAAVLVYTTDWLGGTNTTAAVYLCLALVSAVGTAAVVRRGPEAASPA
jgi:uncharacterized membrane protein YphA (DoxX/SURF4 family)